MITKKEEQEFKKPKLYKIWNFLIYGSFIVSLLLEFSWFIYILHMSL